MKKIDIAYIVIIFTLFFSHDLLAQQPYYEVTPGNGNGLRFWDSSNNYKIHMGNADENKYGPVTDYSIKMNMSNNAAMGWTWGVAGVTPVAALNTKGNMQINGTFKSIGNMSTNGTLTTAKHLETPNIFFTAAQGGQLHNSKYVNILGVNGNGIRFWQSDSYKIHMGNAAENKYGPVQDHSIKMNMSNHAARGWTWGVTGVTPVAALNTQGNMKIKGEFEAAKIKFPDVLT